MQVNTLPLYTPSIELLSVRTWHTNMRSYVHMCKRVQKSAPSRVREMLKQVKTGIPGLSNLVFSSHPLFFWFHELKRSSTKLAFPSGFDVHVDVMKKQHPRAFVHIDRLHSTSPRAPLQLTGATRVCAYVFGSTAVGPCRGVGRECSVVIAVALF